MHAILDAKITPSCQPTHPRHIIIVANPPLLVGACEEHDTAAESPTEPTTRAYQQEGRVVSSLKLLKDTAA